MQQLTLFPEIFIRDRQAFCSSLDVKNHFQKNHRDVLKAIRNAMDVCPAEFNERNFAPVEYTDIKGERRPAYYLTRDGFTVLAMGFTGKEAMQWKLMYLEAFNRMEARITELEKKEAEDKGKFAAACSLTGARAYLAQQALQLIAEGCRFTHVARLLGTSPRTVYRLRKRFGFMGGEAL